MIRSGMLVLAGALVAAGCSEGKEPARSDQAQTSFAKIAQPPTPAAAPVAIPPDIPAPAARPEAFRQTAAGTGAAGQVALPRMLTRSATAAIEVKSLDSAVVAVRAVAARVGGYIGGENVQSGRDELRQAVFQVMVPAARLDEAIAALKPIGKVESVQVESQDVGEEYVDVNARLANQKRLEQRLVTLLETRTGKLEDVLAVERELARVREDIDRLTGRSQYLERQVATSRLQVAVHEPPPLTGAPGSNRVLTAFTDAWRNFVVFVAGFIAALGFLVPLGLIVVGVWWVVRAIQRRRPASNPPEKTQHGLGIS